MSHIFVVSFYIFISQQTKHATLKYQRKPNFTNVWQMDTFIYGTLPILLIDQYCRKFDWPSNRKPKIYYLYPNPYICNIYIVVMHVVHKWIDHNYKKGEKKNFSFCIHYWYFLHNFIFIDFFWNGTHPYCDQHTSYQNEQ